MDWETLFASRSMRMKASEIRELLKLLDQPDIISFAGGIPDPALFPSQDFAKAYEQIFASGEAAVGLQYSVSEGYLPLRRWLVKEMARIGIVCGPDNIVITSGSQQGLDYLGKLLLSPRDTALVTWPTYLGALGAFNAYEPSYDRLSPMGNRAAESYRAQARQAGGSVKFAYVSADFANPTGETMDAEARSRLLDLARELDIAVLEDGAYQALRYDGEAKAPLLAMDIARSGDIEKTRTIYLGSFSKTLAPGLRIGWIVAASPVIRKLVLLKQAADLHSSTINQMVIHKVAEAGFDRQVAKIHAVYHKRRDAMLQSLARNMPKGVSWTKPEGGMFVWVTLPENLDGAALLARSLESERVAFVPGKAFFADGSNANTLRLSFSCPDEATIEEGISRLGRLIAREIAAAGEN